MGPYSPRLYTTETRVAPITFPLSVWIDIQQVAAEASMSAAEWVRRACQEKLQEARP